MHYGKIKFADCANGIGIRISLFVSGCTNRCKGCFQPETWNFEYGEKFTKEIEDKIINELKNSFYNGLTILGGEPLEPSNQEGIIDLIRRVKTECADRTVWIYTGFTYEDDLLKGGRKHCAYTDEIMSLIDVLVDGKFIEEEKDISLRFRGSRNQRIIDMPATLKNGSVELSPEHFKNR